MKTFIAPRGAVILTKYRPIEVGPPPPNEKGIVDTRREGGWRFDGSSFYCLNSPYYLEACRYFTKAVWDKSPKSWESNIKKYNKKRSQYIAILEKEIADIEQMPTGQRRDTFAYWASYFYNDKINDLDKSASMIMR